MTGTITPFPGVTAPHQPTPPAPTIPCPHRQVTADGRVVCQKVPTHSPQDAVRARRDGPVEVSPALCAACPVTQIGCQHLRFTLRKYEPVPITVRYAGGRVEIWDDEPPAMRLTRAACGLRREPIASPADCAGCTLRLVLSGAEGLASPLAAAPEEQRRAVSAR
ncbi:MAG: hypothetical protein KKA73_27665 [Chloroflexi bacterium]|nr:hypothetical protein [Chloroflexota bacterium]